MKKKPKKNSKTNILFPLYHLDGPPIIPSNLMQAIFKQEFAEAFVRFELYTILI